MNLKRTIYSAFFSMQRNPRLRGLTKAVVKGNLVIRHWGGRQRMTHSGTEDPDKVYYVIRSRGDQEGLLSSYNSNAAGKVWQARHNGWIPYIDYTGADCQYYVGREVNGTTNPWEYYFEQPTPDLTREDLDCKRNVLLSGWTLRDHAEIWDEYDSNAWLPEFIQLCPVQPYILNMVEAKYDALFAPGSTLGIFVRGTDYTHMEPKGHPRQPSVAQIIEQTDTFLARHPITRIYVVTEDYSIYQTIQGRYGDMVFAADDRFVCDYNGWDYVSYGYTDDAYERGLYYLIRLLLLARCDYLVASHASGSTYSILMNQGRYLDQYLFELGNYGENDNRDSK